MSLSSTSGASSTSSQDYLALLGNLSPLPFDPNTVVTGMLAGDQQRVTNLQASVKNIQNDQTSYKAIGADVAALQSAAFNLTLQSSVQATTATSSNAAAVTATASPSAIAGAYSIGVTHLATATTAASTGGLGISVDAHTTDTALSALNLRSAATGGTFSVVVDGQVQSVTVDTPKALKDPTGGALYNLQQQITAALHNDPGAQANVTVAGNKVQVAVTGGDPTKTHTISFGSAGDSSNFLALTNLSTVAGTISTGAAALTSTAVVGVAQPSAVLASAGLGTTLNSSGSFSVNGVSISYNAATDSLSAVIQRINNSTAGVTASYDSAADRLVLTNKVTGQNAIALADAGGGNGNFLAAMGLAPGTTTAQALGQNAVFSVNGATLSSPSNTVTSAVPGLSLTLTAATGGTPATLTVGADVTGITAKVQAFVDAANKVLGDINLTQQKDPTSGGYSDLLGDPTLVGLKNTLIKMVTSSVTATGTYQSLQDIGLTTGAVGSTPGSTTSFTLNKDKLAAAITANPGAVANLFLGTSGTAGFTGAAQQLNTYLTQQTSPLNGPFALYQQTGNTRLQSIQNQITQQNRMIDQKRQTLLAQFTAMSQALTQLSSESSFFTAMSNSQSSSSSSSGH